MEVSLPYRLKINTSLGNTEPSQARISLVAKEPNRIRLLPQKEIKHLTSGISQLAGFDDFLNSCQIVSTG